MADVRALGVNGNDRPARSVLAGADRASGERVRRRQRTTPLLPSEPSAAATGQSPEPRPAAKKAAAKKRAANAAAAQSPASSALKKSPASKPATKQAAAGKKSAAMKKAVPVKQDAASPPTKKAGTAEKTSAAKGSPDPSAPTKVAVTPAGAPPAKRAAAERTGPRSTTAPVSHLTVAPPPPSAPLTTPPAREAIEVDEPLPAGGTHSVALAIASQLGEALLDAVISRARPAEIESAFSSILSFARRRLTGDYELDDFGFDPEFTEKVPLALLKPLYKHWFRVEVRGIENIPSEGGALVVANHSGTLPLDAVMTAVAVHEAHPDHRFLRTLGADLVFQTPFLAGLARRAGATLASNPDAERLLSEGHLVGVWPEGFKGIGKPFSERYKLQRFGRGGFVSAALRTGTPIIPCSIVGAEEIFPIIGDIPSLARLLGLPYIPITPFFPWLGPLGAIPLPSKWLIEFGPPVGTHEYGKSAADDPMLVFDLTDQVRQSIQQTLYSLLVQRRSIFF